MTDSIDPVPGQQVNSGLVRSSRPFSQVHPGEAGLIDLVAEVIQQVRSSNASFARNLVPDLLTWPIPFFGDPLEAQVLTIGLNPSPGEFADGRWVAAPQDDTHYLLRRLQAYFDGTFAKPHHWFEPWRTVLRELGVSYKDRSAAHLDVPPRATIPVRQAPDKDLFEEMLRQDVRWLFRVLAESRRCSLVLLAGCSAKAYLDKFLELTGSRAQPPVIIKGRRTLSKGDGKTALLHLVLPDRTIPMFFCSRGPSDTSGAGMLEDRARENLAWLRLAMRAGS